MKLKWLDVNKIIIINIIMMMIMMMMIMIMMIMIMMMMTIVIVMLRILMTGCPIACHPTIINICLCSIICVNCHTYDLLLPWLYNVIRVNVV